MKFEDWDKAYREHPIRDLPWELGRPREVLLEIVGGRLIHGHRALDICCGTGTNALYLAQQHFAVTAMDVSESAIDIARQKAEGSGARIRFLVADWLNLPFEDKEFDLIFDMGCFHHVEPENRERFIRGVHRVLADGGWYMLTVFSYRNGPGPKTFTKAQLESLWHPPFEIKKVDHFPSLEGDGKTRYFFSLLMQKA